MGGVAPLLEKPLATVEVDGAAFIGLERDGKMNKEVNESTVRCQQCATWRIKSRGTTSHVTYVPNTNEQTPLDPLLSHTLQMLTPLKQNVTLCCWWNRLQQPWVHRWQDKEVVEKYTCRRRITKTRNHRYK